MFLGKCLVMLSMTSMTASYATAHNTIADGFDKSLFLNAETLIDVNNLLDGLQSNRMFSCEQNIAILRCNVAILMRKLLGPNCNRFEKWLSKSYNVNLKIYLQIIFVKGVYLIYKAHVGKNNKCNLIF